MHLFIQFHQLEGQVECLGFGEAFDLHHKLDANFTQGKALRVGLNCLKKPDCHTPFGGSQ
jgi:hypothetical protein